MKPFDLVICDEIHKASSYCSNINAHLSAFALHSVIVGLTATIVQSAYHQTFTLLRLMEKTIMEKYQMPRILHPK